MYLKTKFSSSNSVYQTSQDYSLIKERMARLVGVQVVICYTPLPACIAHLISVILSNKLRAQRSDR
jgi:hypothetical protein